MNIHQFTKNASIFWFHSFLLNKQQYKKVTNPKYGNRSQYKKVTNPYNFHKNTILEVNERAGHTHILHYILHK